MVRGLAGTAAWGVLSGGAVQTAASATLAPIAQTPEPQTLKVLVLNAWIGGKRVRGGTEMIAQIIEASGASLVFLLEAKETTGQIVTKLNASGANFQYRMTGDTAIISSHPMSEAVEFPFMTKAVVTVGPLEVAAYAAHLEYRWYATYLPRGYGAGVPRGELSESGWGKIPDGPTTDVATISRVNEASGRPKEIADFISDAHNEQARNRAVILGGDFNEPSALDWTPGTTRLFDHNGVVMRWESTQALHDAGFLDAYRDAHPDPVTHPGFTWPASNPNVGINELTWAPEADERDRIDYVFHSPDPRVQLTSAEVVGPRASIVRSERVDEPGEDPFLLADTPWPTDHKGVLASYQLRG